MPPRLEKGLSDPVSFQCTCAASHQEGDEEEEGGLVLLFYRYYANDPPLPSNISINNDLINELATWHKNITQKLNILGKIRIASEGFNITVGGTKASIKLYISSCLEHWSFRNLPLSSVRERKSFFKPSEGCACVFHPATEASVRICNEITPLGITNYVPRRWDSVEELPPAEFHRRCHEQGDRVTLLDLRNYYESRIGWFVNPTSGEEALKPQIRRFSQWPKYFDRYKEEMKSAARGDGADGEQILTYCTGGIRCEKATRWMAERDDGVVQGRRQIATLKGGIAAYLDWVGEEICAGRMTSRESLFKGKNYVFDARGAVSLDCSSEEPVSKCHVCGIKNDRLSKCRTLGCHLVLVVCDSCESTDPRCCETCHDQRGAGSTVSKSREMCLCEKTREFGLWGTTQSKKEKEKKGKSRNLHKADTEHRVLAIQAQAV